MWIMYFSFHYIVQLIVYMVVLRVGGVLHYYWLSQRDYVEKKDCHNNYLLGSVVGLHKTLRYTL